MRVKVSAATRATLLLCARLGEGRENLRPLTARRFHGLACWLGQQRLSVGDLLAGPVRARMRGLTVGGVTPGTIAELLNREEALEWALGEWARRGVWVVSRTDEAYPDRLRDRLGAAAPPLLFGVGAPGALSQRGMAVVGSRDASDDDLGFARRVAAQCAEQGVQVISGAARGIDLEAMTATLEAGGECLGVLAEGLCRSGRVDTLRNTKDGERVTLVSPFDPEAHWFAGAAMERNKLIYALAEAALVVSATADGGGTWNGAVDALKRARIPVYARAGEAATEGNRKLIASGARPFPEQQSRLRELWAEEARPRSLFDPPLAGVAGGG